MTFALFAGPSERTEFPESAKFIKIPNTRSLAPAGRHGGVGEEGGGGPEEDHEKKLVPVERTWLKNVAVD